MPMTLGLVQIDWRIAYGNRREFCTCGTHLEAVVHHSSEVPARQQVSKKVKIKNKN